MKIKPLDWNIEKAMKKLREGEFSIPRFQRNFVWSSSKIISLGKSLMSNFPIGALTTWRPPEDVFNGRNEIVETLSGKVPNNDSMLVIDGQQRLTSIAILYFAYDIQHDIDLKRYSDPLSKTISGVYNSILFVNKDFVDKKEYLEQLEEEGYSKTEAREIANNHKISNKNINLNVQELLSEYPLFIHTILEADIMTIIDIFRAMNSKVVPLTHVDLMNGSMFNVSKDNFDLLDFINKANDNWKNFGKISQELFVILMKIYSDTKLKEDVKYKSDDLVTWANNVDKAKHFIDRRHDFEDKVKSAISAIERNLNIYTIKNLPKDVYMISVFTIICILEMGAQDPRFNDILHKTINHITRRLVTGDYSSSPNAKAIDDINKVIHPLCFNEEPDYSEFTYDESSVSEQFKIITKDLSYKKKSASMFKLSMSVLASMRPWNLFDKGLVQVSSSETSKIDIDMHHFIPKKSNMVKKYNISEDRINKIGNLILIGKKENIRILNSDINEYLIEASEETSNPIEKILSSHTVAFDDVQKVIDQYEKNDDNDSVIMNKLLDQLWESRELEIKKKIYEKFVGYNPENIKWN